MSDAMLDSAEFHGAKLFAFIGARLVVIRRDDIATIPWPGRLDVPGGGREGDETPVACALRETHEEVGLTLIPSDLVWRRSFATRDGVSWFFAARLSVGREAEIRLGDEGTEWDLIAPEDYLNRLDAIPPFQDRLRLCLSEITLPF